MARLRTFREDILAEIDEEMEKEPMDQEEVTQLKKDQDAIGWAIGVCEHYLEEWEKEQSEIQKDKVIHFRASGPNAKSGPFFNGSSPTHPSARNSKPR